MSNCCVIGLGYIGLPTAVILAQSGHNVYGVDINPEIVSSVNKGLLHFKEPELDKLLLQSLKKSSFLAGEKPFEADVFIIAVPTPTKSNEKNIPQPNIDYILDAAKEISKVIKPGNLVLLESTAPVGTTEEIALLIMKLSKLKSNEIFFAYCPERVFPGKILYELINNNRIVGGYGDAASIKAKRFYSTFCKGEISISNCRTAELVKLTENAFRDVNIAFANELSIVCNQLNLDVFNVIEKSNLHPRVNILKPGCGVGGHCIAIDPWFIAANAPEITPLIQTARKVNNNKPIWVVDKIIDKANILAKKLSREPVIGCFGLTFKPDVDDYRESAALKIVTELINKGLNIIACDPNLNDHKLIKLHADEYLMSKADLYVILVAHTPFKNLDFYKKDYLDFCGLNNIL